MYPLLTVDASAMSHPPLPTPRRPPHRAQSHMSVHSSSMCHRCPVEECPRQYRQRRSLRHHLLVKHRDWLCATYPKETHRGDEEAMTAAATRAISGTGSEGTARGAAAPTPPTAVPPAVDNYFTAPPLASSGFGSGSGNSSSIGLGLGAGPSLGMGPPGLAMGLGPGTTTTTAVTATAMRATYGSGSGNSGRGNSRCGSNGSGGSSSEGWTNAVLSQLFSEPGAVKGNASSGVGMSSGGSLTGSTTYVNHPQAQPAASYSQPAQFAQSAQPTQPQTTYLQQPMPQQPARFMPPRSHYSYQPALPSYGQTPSTAAAAAAAATAAAAAAAAAAATRGSRRPNYTRDDSSDAYGLGQANASPPSRDAASFTASLTPSATDAKQLGHQRNAAATTAIFDDARLLAMMPQDPIGAAAYIAALTTLFN